MYRISAALKMAARNGNRMNSVSAGMATKA